MFTCLLLIFFDGYPKDWLAEQRLKLPAARQQIEQAMCDWSFGEKQVEQFIRDRPGTGKIIARERILRLMLIWHFAGELKGHRVYWDDREPTAGRPAEHHLSWLEYPALVRVSNMSDSSAVDKCTMLVFEMYNLQNQSDFKQLYRAAQLRLIDRDEYAKFCVRLEFEAMKRTQAYFRKFPITNANFTKDDAYYGVVLFAYRFSDYLRALDELDDTEYSPLKFFGQAYDKMRPAPNRSP